MSASQKLATSSPNPKPESWEDVAKLVTMAQESEAYLKYLGLKRNPFPVAPDAEVFFLPARIDSMITEVLHCIYTRKGFLVITGEVGLGKTTVSRRVLRTLDETQVETALVFNTFIQGADLLEEINRDFGIETAKQGPQENMAALNRFLIDRYNAGINCAIVIDDAQNLTEESLEMVRMISNLEAQAEKLVQILLVGQPELEVKLDTHALRQLKSRIVIHARMRPYSQDELKQYIAFKLNAAGSAGGIMIPEGSYRLLHELTFGNPRRVNNLMDRCLYGLFAYNTTRLTRKVILEVAKELGMSRPQVDWGRWVKRIGLPVVGVLLIGAVVFLGPRWYQQAVLLEASRPDTVQAQLAKEAAVAELARAKAERERASEELAQAQSARQTTTTELAKARAESEHAREAVARAQVAEAKALTQVANAKEMTQVEAASRKQALTEARVAREAAEAAAAQSELALTQAKSRAESQAKALAAALEAQKKSEAQTAKISQELARLQAESEAQAKALVTATKVREEAEARALAAQKDAQQARQEAELSTANSEEEKKILAAAQSARQQAEAEAITARKEAQEAFKRIELVRQEAEKAMAQTKAEAEARLAQAEAAQQQAEAEALRSREGAAQELTRLQAEQAKREKELVKSKGDADRQLAEALAARTKAESEAQRAREESERVIKSIEQAKNLDQAGKEQALAQAKSAQEMAVKEREAEAARVGLVVAKAEEVSKKQAQAMEELLKARQSAEESAQKAKELAEQALVEAKLMRERAAQDVDLAQMDAKKAQQELLIAKKQMQEMVAQQPGGDRTKSVVEVAPQVKQFLAAYGLEEYAQDFAQGLNEGWLDGVVRRIEEEKGLHLVALSSVPEELQSKYPVLPQGKRQLLFWKPEFSINTFYYDHAGPEVRTLQGHLHRLGLYSSSIDGVVGRLTMSALTLYQKQRNLPLTGQPDDATLFLLTHDKPGVKGQLKVVASVPVVAANAPVEQVKPLVDQKGNWVIQLGSFRVAKEAEAFVKKLAGQGVEAVVAPLGSQAGTVRHTVRTPPMGDRANIEQVLANLNAKFGLKGFIMEHQDGMVNADTAATRRK